MNPFRLLNDSFFYMSDERYVAKKKKKKAGSPSKPTKKNTDAGQQKIQHQSTKP